MPMAAYCSHGDSLGFTGRLAPASVTLRHLRLFFLFLSHKHEGLRAAAATFVCRLFYSVPLCFVGDTKRVLGRRKRSSNRPHTPHCEGYSMSRRGNFPHGGVFQGMGAAAALSLCCLVNADTRYAVLAPARGMLRLQYCFHVLILFPEL